ncbi:hypothetical protein M514_04802 [Trichuris suis]|uniref:Uncharacterized protein n=1 Tax=Trichuris suis TaxID=68888 RepID=A0A085MAL4_9BILA|nr:hypothetical protein M513_04802 [Trichuris suis]KFD73186.1 hypothetical protein M514_04802 [Trichuris suis]
MNPRSVGRPYECSLDISVVKGVAERIFHGLSELFTNLRYLNAEEFGTKLVAFVDEKMGESTFSYLDIFNSQYNQRAAFG